MMECKSALQVSQRRPGRGRSRPPQTRHRRGLQEGLRATKQGLVAATFTPVPSSACWSRSIAIDFVARTGEFQQLVHDIAMQIAAADPRFIRKEDVTPEFSRRNAEIQRARALAEGKPEKIVDKIVEGRLSKFYEEVCLYEQPFIKENTITMGQMIASRSPRPARTSPSRGSPASSWATATSRLAPPGLIGARRGPLRPHPA